MGRFRIQELIDLLLQFAIILIPLLLAVLVPLLKRLFSSRQEARKPPQTHRRPETLEPRPSVPARPRDEGQVIAEIRRLMERRAKDAADVPARPQEARRQEEHSLETPSPELRPHVHGREASSTRPVPVRPPEAAHRREVPLEVGTPVGRSLDRNLESVSEMVQEHLSHSLESKEALAGAGLPTRSAPVTEAAPPKPRARAASTVRVLSSPEFRRMLRSDPLFVLLAAEIFGPCRAASGLEGSPTAPAGLRRGR